MNRVEIILLSNLTKRYDTPAGMVNAIEDLNMTIYKGDFILIRGRSGSGKSTLLNLLAAFDKPTSGKIIVSGEDITKLSEIFSAKYRREKIGFIFQQFNLLEDMTGFDNLMLPMLPSGKSLQYMKNRIAELSSIFKLEEKLSTPVWKLSGGEKQRLAVVRALVNDPEIILADEPTANLDVNLSKELLDTLLSLNNMGKTVILVSHDEMVRNYSFSKSYTLESGNLDVSLP